MSNTVKLKDVCEFKRGLTYSKKDEVDYSNNVVVRATNIDLKTNKLNLAQLKYIKESIKINEDKILKKGDILICTASGSKSHLGKVALIDKDIKMAFGGFMGVLRTSEKCLPKFLCNILVSQKFKKVLLSNTSGANINNLRFSQIENFEFMLPSLPEQQRIVVKLDTSFAEIDMTINKVQKLIENTNLLFEKKIKQYFIDNVTNAPFVKLSDISEYFNGLTYSPKDVSENGIIVLRSGNIQNGKMEYSDIKRVNKKIKDKLYVKPSDLLICSRNGSQRLIGKSSLIGEIKEPMTFGTFMMIVRSEHNKYLQWFIKSKLFKKQIIKGENTMINQITRYMLDDISLPFPDKKIYSKIVKELEELDGHVRILNKILNIKIDNFKKLKSSILKQELLNKVA